MNNFRKWLLEEMGKRNMSGTQLADMIGCAPRTIWHYQCGDRSPRLEVAEKILDALGFRMEIVKKKGEKHD